jgi:hypothetical protein
MKSTLNYALSARKLWSQKPGKNQWVLITNVQQRGLHSGKITFICVGECANALPNPMQTYCAITIVDVLLGLNV